MEELISDIESLSESSDSSPSSSIQLRAPILYVNDCPLYNSYDYIRGKFQSERLKEESESESESESDSVPVQDQRFLVVPPRTFNRKQRERIRLQYTFQRIEELDPEPIPESKIEPEVKYSSVPEIHINDLPIEYGSFSGYTYDFLNGKLIEEPVIDEAIYEDFGEYYDIESHNTVPSSVLNKQERLKDPYDFFDFDFFEEEDIDGEPMDVDTDEDILELGRLPLSRTISPPTLPPLILPLPILPSPIFVNGEEVGEEYNFITAKPNSECKDLDSNLTNADTDEDFIDLDLAEPPMPLSFQSTLSNNEDIP